MKKYFTIISLLMFSLLISEISAQTKKFAVHFSDKNNSPYSINEPLEFLSQRAVDRRAKFNILITEEDFPVNPAYVTGLETAGANVTFTSRWLNCALVSCSQTIADQIAQLSYVSQVVYVSPGSYAKDAPRRNHKWDAEEAVTPVTKGALENYEYGYGFNQINQLNGIPVHEQGFSGEGVLVAVLDGGFENANNIGAFSRLFNEGRIVFTKDFVTPNGNVYASNTSDHGTMVLSCMGSFLEGQFIGTAPEASYALIRTEEGATEYLIECYNWTLGAEAADSIGADIINSSLGYSTFDDASMDYTFAQMDGQTAISSIGAKKATERGIFVTLSAGNSNGTNWPWIGTPPDVVNAATIGAIDGDGEIAYFSSKGPNAAGDLKPNFVARGISSTVIEPSGNISSANGTSFSSPITCGMIACLIQANSSVLPWELRQIIETTSDRYPNHDIFYGYGIPDYAEALEIIQSLGPVVITEVSVNDPDGNGKLNPGETVTLNVTMQNISDEAITNVDATLNTSNSFVTINSNSSNFGSFAAGETKTISNVFSITLSEDAMPNTEIRFATNAICDNNLCVSNFNLMVWGILLDYHSVYFDDAAGNGNGILEPGEIADMQLFVRNAGNETAFDVNALLSSDYEYLTINSNTSNYGNILGEQTKSASFNVTLSEATPPNNIIIPFSLQLTDNEGTITNLIFTYQNKCNIVFNLHDSFGDGWNGASINVSFDDGTPTEILTINQGSSSETYTLEINSGTVVTLSWQSGAWDEECSFEITYEDGTVIYQASEAPGSGVFYTFTNNCGSQSPIECEPATDLTTAVSENTVNLTWAAPTLETPEGYNIYRDEQLLFFVSTTSFTETNVPAGAHDYCVFAVYTDCFSEGICESVTVENQSCETPANVQFSTTGTPMLSWNGSSDALSYNVFHNGELYANVSETSIEMTNLIVNTEHCFNVSAVCESGESAESETACGVIEYCNPLTNVTVTATDNNILLMWGENVSLGAVYNIYRNGEFIAATTQMEYLDENLENGTYCYIVKIVCIDGESNSSNEACATVHVGIDEMENAVQIFPNPATTTLTITGSDIDRIDMYNITGQLLETKYFAASESVTMNVSGYSNGMYLMKIKTNDGTFLLRKIAITK